MLVTLFQSVFLFVLILTTNYSFFTVGVPGLHGLLASFFKTAF